MFQLATTPVQSYESIRVELNAMLEAFFDQKITETSAMSTQYARLWKILYSLSRSGGKRIRPYMVTLAYRSFGGADHRSVMRVALAWELLHLCMLIHDDIIDNDFVRYGVSNVAGSYREIYHELGGGAERQAHLADAAALLAGDLALSAAYEVVLDGDLPAESKVLAQKYLARAAFIVVGGELLDSEAALYPMMEADPILIAKLKTASYTFTGPLSTGAALAGASAADLASIEQLGEALGYAYQFQDDLLGVFGDPAATGKSATGDLSEGKRTHLMQQTFLLAEPSDVHTLQTLVGKADLSDEEADTVRDIITRSGAKAQTEATVQQYIDRAYQIVESLTVSDQHRDEIRNLITATIGRQR